MTPRIALPPDLAARAFTTADAAAAGVGEGRLRGRDLTRPFHGVRMAAEDIGDLRALCRAKLTTMRESDVFSHITACLLYDIPVPARLRDGRIHVASVAPDGIPRGRGVCGHRLTAGSFERWWRRGLPIVSPEDAWCELAGELDERELIVAGDALVRRRGPLSSIERMTEVVARHRGRVGHARLEAALHRVRPGTDSPAESELRLDLVDYGLPEPEVNVVIFDRDGLQIAIGDLVYLRYRILTEYDGEQHRVDDRQYGRDIDRLDDVMDGDWRVIRFNKSHRGVRRLERLERVRQALLRRGWRPGMHA